MTTKAELDTGRMMANIRQDRLLDVIYAAYVEDVGLSTWNEPEFQWCLKYVKERYEKEYDV